MRGGKHPFRIFSSVQRAKVYFLVIALLMTMTLCILSYKWNFTEKMYGISTHQSLNLQKMLGNAMHTHMVSVEESIREKDNNLFTIHGNKLGNGTSSNYNHESLKNSSYVITSNTHELDRRTISGSKSKPSPKDMVSKSLNENTQVNENSKGVLEKNPFGETESSSEINRIPQEQSLSVKLTTILPSSSKTDTNDEDGEQQSFGKYINLPSVEVQNVTVYIPEKKVQILQNRSYYYKLNQEQPGSDKTSENKQDTNTTASLAEKGNKNLKDVDSHFTKMLSTRLPISNDRTHDNQENIGKLSVKDTDFLSNVESTESGTTHVKDFTNTYVIHPDVNDTDSVKNGTLVTGPAEKGSYDSKPNKTSTKTVVSETGIAENKNKNLQDKYTFGASKDLFEVVDKTEIYPAQNHQRSFLEMYKDMVRRRGDKHIPIRGNSKLKSSQIGIKNTVNDQFKHGALSFEEVIHPYLTARAPNAQIRPDMCRGCFKTNFKQIINVPNLCTHQTDITVLLMISSSPSNLESRKAIRQTWGSVCNKPDSKIKCVFVFGRDKHDFINEELVTENRENNDMLQFDFRDSYANLTYKTMMSLRWSSENCKEAKFVMKTDDDMYVNTDLLLVMLTGAPSSRFLGGFCWGPSSPHRDMNSKWYVSFEQFSQPLFPKMCSGTGYVMSRDVVIGVLKQSADIPFFHLEDVYVSLCLKKLGIQPVSLTGFFNSRVDFDACTYRNQVITSHGFTADALEYMWPVIQGCPKEKLTPEMVFFPRFFR